MTGWSHTSVYTNRTNTNKYALQALVEVAQGLNPKVILDREIAYVITDRLERARQENANL